MAPIPARSDGPLLRLLRAKVGIDRSHAPRSRGGSSVTENCVPACLSCNGQKGDTEIFIWYRSQSFYDPRRAMALRAWGEGDMKLALRLLEWVRPTAQPSPAFTRPDRPRHPHGACRWPPEPQGAPVPATGPPKPERPPKPGGSHGIGVFPGFRHHLETDGQGPEPGRLLADCNRAP